MPERNLVKVRSRAIYTLYIVALLDLLAVSLFLPIITREIKHLGASPLMVGVMGSIYGGIQLFSSPIIGRESDKYGRRLIIISMLAATALAYVLQGSAANLSFLLMARCLAGLFKHTQTIGKAMLADLAPSEKSYVLGNVNAFGSMGYIVGPTLGGYLATLENGFQHVSYLAAAVFVVNIVLIFVFVPETSSKFQKDSSNSTKEKTDGNQNNCFDVNTGSMSRKTIFAVMLIRFLFSFSTLVPRANLALIFDSKYQASVVSQGYLTSLQALIGTLTGFMVGPVLSKLYNEGHRSMVFHGGIIHMISLFGLFLSPSFALAGFCLTLVSAVNPFQRVGIAALSLAGTEDPGAMLGLGQTATSLARMLAPTMAGLTQTFSDDGPALLGTITALAGIIATLCLIPASQTAKQYVKVKSS